MVDLSVHFAGLKLNNPLIASAGPITAEYESVKRLAEAGIGAVITKTGFTEREYEQWVGKRIEFPFKPVYKYQGFENGALFSLPTLSDVPVDRFARRIEKMKELEIPVIASIMGLSLRGYRESARIAEAAGADAIEIDLCCTIPDFVTKHKYAGENATLNPRYYARIVRAVKNVVSIPVGVKSTLSLYAAPRVLEGLVRLKLRNSVPDFITIVGQLDHNPGVNLDTLLPVIPHVPSFGWTGALSELTYSELAVFSSTLGTVDPLLSASGGIGDWRGAVTCLALGATTVQLQSVILRRGAGVVKRIIGDLTEYADARGIDSLHTIIGTAAKHFIPALALGDFMRERYTLFGRIYAVVDDRRCTGCGLCEQVCPDSAIHRANERPNIDESLCRACNLCVITCPAGALSLSNEEALNQLIETYKRSEKARDFRKFMSARRIGIADLVGLHKKLKYWGFI
jgi:dihydroorotate dehydrogenase/ferredoxin